MSDDWKRRCAIALLLAAVFTVALVVRMTYRSERAAAFEQINPYQSFIAHRRAVRMLEGRGVLLWDDTDPRLIKQIRRPPGYSILLAALYTVTGPDLRTAQLAQVLVDALAAAGVAAIALWLVSWRAAIVAGLLYGLSPHLAVYATIVTPDAVASWPVLAGGALFIAALRRRDWWRFALAAAGGLAIGASCWLTAQGMTLPFALLAVGVVVAAPGERRRAAATGAVLALAAIASILPLTVRNIAVYGVSVPIRPGLGVTLVEGLGVYDPSFPATDGALLADEAVRFGRPDYEDALYQPDGVERERDRVRRATDAITARPIWFAGVMLDRMRLMLIYDADGPAGWPDDTAYVGTTEQSVVRFVQRTVFHTWFIWLLILAGAACLVLRGEWRMALLLSAIPLHHLLLQSLLLTEYKYTLPVHAWLFVIAAATVELTRDLRCKSTNSVPS